MSKFLTIGNDKNYRRVTADPNRMQLSLGDLIALLEATEQKDIGGNFKTVWLDVPDMMPSSIASYRGSYDELAIGFTELRFDGEANKFARVDNFIKTLKGAIGETFEGYKGGSNRMSSTTPLWVAQWGSSSSIAPYAVLDGSYYITILSTYTEF